MVTISAGSYDLNRWLHGGYEQEIITVLFGAPGSGKTTFCLLAAVSQAKKGKKVIYIDTEGGFSVERIKQLADEAYTTILDRLLVLKPTTFDEQKEAFVTLLKHLKEEVGLIVVDGMTMLYRLDFAAARSKNKDEMRKVSDELVRQVRMLAEIARKREIPVLVTSQVYRWEGEEKIVGGDILQYWGKCLLELQVTGGKRKAILRKHRHLGERELEFVIKNEGIKKKGWLG